MTNQRKNPARRGLDKVVSRADAERIENSVHEYPGREELLEGLRTKGVVSLTNLGSFTLVEAWLVIPLPTWFRQIVDAMKKHRKRFKDCDPRREDPLSRDFKSGNKALDNILLRGEASSFALLQRITISQLKQRVPYGLGPERIALLKATLAKSGITIHD